jgi:anti-sigma factor RsiW
MNRDDLIDLIPAYALGALDADEKAEFETWLAGDLQAQALLAEYRQVADRLVIAAPLRAAPPHLQADLRRRLATTRTKARSRLGGWSGGRGRAIVLVVLSVMIASGKRTIRRTLLICSGHRHAARRELDSGCGGRSGPGGERRTGGQPGR